MCELNSDKTNNRIKDIYREIYSLVKQIPEGKVSTYKRIAEAMGDPLAARGVAEALSINPLPVKIPCHRVVHEDLTLGGFRFGIEEKKRMLENEGITIEKNRVKAEIFDDFRSTEILEQMKAEQEKMSKKVELEDSDFELVAGFDVSYSDRFAKGAICIMNKKLEPIEVRTGYEPSCMPYIPTYLGFRELPLFRKLSKGLKNVLYFIDGNGIMHPRFCGSACMLGLEANAPAIGVAKSKLLGEISENRVVYKGRQVGWKKNNLFISQGNKISLQKALELTGQFSIYKMPEPLRLAHINARISKQR
ncbi:MAG: endonuclease V [Candidatus Thermoplasmatota archaeon]|nr:endonuclease V [Candidatus Thermoplasmatota archaeon]